MAFRYHFLWKESRDILTVVSMLFICFIEFTDPCRTQTLLESESCVLTLEKSIKVSMEQIVGYSRRLTKLTNP